MSKIIKYCIICNKRFEVYPCFNRIKCCSRKCSNISQRGKKLSIKRRKRLSQIAKERNFGKWMIGKKASLKTKQKMSESIKKNLPKTIFKKGYLPWNKGKKMPQMEKANNWRGGKIKIEGYILIKNKIHPFRTKNNYILRSHLIMEKYLGRYLKKGEIVHHKGTKYPLGSIENRQDDRPENLQLFANVSAHRKWHFNHPSPI